MKNEIKKVVRRRARKHFTLSPTSIKLIAKLKKKHDDNESRVIDAALKALAEASA